MSVIFYNFPPQKYSIFNQEDIEDFRAVFNYFTNGKREIISAKQVRTALRSLQPKPKDQDINEIFDNITAKKGGEVDFHGFLDALHTAIDKVRKQHIKDNKDRKKSQAQVNECFCVKNTPVSVTQSDQLRWITLWRKLPKMV